MVKLLQISLALALSLTAVALIGAWKIGAWHVLFPSTAHDVQAPAIARNLAEPAVLLFSKTNGFRHRDGIAAGNRLLSQQAAQLGWGVFATENGAVFNAADLQRFAVVVFQNATGDMLSAAQRAALARWVESGGGWLGVHAAGDGSHSSWPWYLEQLLGAEFTAHTMGPQFQRASVLIDNAAHPVNRDMKHVWSHEEEWYSWQASPRGRGFTILATLDEDSYAPVQKMFTATRDLRMGDHPVAWSHCVGSGRSVYAAMGHRAQSFDNPEFQKLLRNALTWLGDAQRVCE